MTVAELIDLLQTYPQNLQVAYDKYSEHCLLDPGDVRLYEACEPRPDGWVPCKRPDKPVRTYLMLPGN